MLPFMRLEIQRDKTGCDLRKITPHEKLTLRNDVALISRVLGDKRDLADIASVCKHNVPTLHDGVLQLFCVRLSDEVERAVFEHQAMKMLSADDGHSL